MSDRGRLSLGRRAMAVRVQPLELLTDLVEETVCLHVDRDPDGIRETEGIGPAVALHGDALQAQEYGAVVLARIEPAAHSIDRAAGEQVADASQQRMPEGRAEVVHHQLDRAFRGLERDIAGEAVGD